jgi:hypothetical protein
MMTLTAQDAKKGQKTNKIQLNSEEKFLPKLTPRTRRLQ